MWPPAAIFNLVVCWHFHLPNLAYRLQVEVEYWMVHTKNKNTCIIIENGT